VSHSGESRGVTRGNQQEFVGTVLSVLVEKWVVTMGVKKTRSGTE